MAKKVVNDNPLEIPYNRAVRVGNFKLWRSKYVVASGKEKTSIDCLHISNLDGSWMTRIPATSGMYGFFLSQYATFDEELRDNVLGMIMTNQLNVCLTPSPALHDALFFLTEMMSFPYNLLPEKEMVKRMKDNMKKLGVDKKQADEHISKMVEYRKQLYELIERKKAAFIEDYERQQSERWAKEGEAQEQLEQDDTAEQMLEVLNSYDGKS
jgi:hypothetical protein